MNNPVSLAPSRIGLVLLLWILGSVYIASNTAPWQLTAVVESDAADIAQLFYSRDQAWAENVSLLRNLAPGANAITFTLPQLWPGDRVRLDPGRRPASYRIASLRWRHGGFDFAVPLANVENANRESCGSSLADSALMLQCQGVDSQLFVPTPAPWQKIASCAIPLGVPLLGLLLLFQAARRRSVIFAATTVLSACALCFCIVTLLHGPTLPLYDDWRYLVPGPFDLVDFGNWSWLTVVGNDTYFLTNQLLDFSVLQLTNVDFFSLRAVALVLLLLQLHMQWKVITRHAGGDPSVAAVAVALGVWSLCSNGFWGTTAIAYQQFLPTLFGTCMLLVVTRMRNDKLSLPSAAALLACAAASGLAYISGGLLVLSLGIACWARTWGVLRAPLRRSPALLLIPAGIALLALQFVLVSHQQGSLLQHNHAVSSVYPTDQRFWFFFFALFGRALGYDGNCVPVDMMLTLLFVLPAPFLAWRMLRPVAASGVEESNTSSWWTLLYVYAVAGGVGYAAVVAFGRAGFVPADSSAQAIAALGKARFHYWPLAAMLPYCWLGWAELARRAQTGSTALRAAIAVALVVPKSTMAMAHDYYISSYRDVAQTGAACIAAHVEDAQQSRPVFCEVITAARLDLGPLLLRLKQRGSPLYVALLREGNRARRSAAGDGIFHDTGR